jgi:hypothetical protein
MTELDGNYWRRPARPGTGGEVRVTGPAVADARGCALPAGSLGGGVVVQVPNGAVGRGIFPLDKTAPRGR